MGNQRQGLETSPYFTYKHVGSFGEDSESARTAMEAPFLVNTVTTDTSDPGFSRQLTYSLCQ